MLSLVLNYSKYDCNDCKHSSIVLTGIHQYQGARGAESETKKSTLKEVHNGGEFQYDESLKLSDLITLAGGLRPTTLGSHLTLKLASPLKLSNMGVSL